MDSKKLSSLLALVSLVGLAGACTLQPEKPAAVNLNEMKNFTDSKRQILVTFGGHFKYANLNDPYGQFVQFVPLRVESISLEQSKLHRSLQLNSDCAKVSMSIIDDKWGTMVTGVQVNLTVPNGQVSSCELDYYFLKMWSPVSEHYYCSKARSLGCHAGGKNGPLVGTLVVEYLEFETDGDSELTEKGEFSSERHNCQ